MPEAWFKRLQDGRLEVFLKTESLKVRASGTADAMNELADWFEEKTGARVEAEWRSVKPRVVPGQLAMGELSSFATVDGDA